jgi:hypothetical protein
VTKSDESFIPAFDIKNTTGVSPSFGRNENMAKKLNALRFFYCPFA